MKLIISFFVNAFAIWLSTQLIAGVSFDSWQSLAMMTIVLAIVNTLIRPIVRLISIPFTIMTLGLFNVIINAAMIGLASMFVPGFSIENIFAGIMFAVVLSVVSTVLGWFVK